MVACLHCTAPLYFGPPNALNPWGNNRVATNIEIRGLRMFTTALKQPDVQQIMSGERAAVQLLLLLLPPPSRRVCGVWRPSTGSFGVYECPAGGYCPPNSSAPTGAHLLQQCKLADCLTH